jgi:hypothetical protein
MQRIRVAGQLSKPADLFLRDAERMGVGVSDLWHGLQCGSLKSAANACTTLKTKAWHSNRDDYI